MNQSIRITAATSLDGYSAPHGVVASIQRLVDKAVLICQFDEEMRDDAHNASLLDSDGKELWRVSAGRVVP